MSYKTSLTQEEQHVEALLGQLHPTRHSAMRDKLMFRAGRASAGHLHLWQGISSAFALLLVCSLTMRVTPTVPEPETMTRQVDSVQWPISQNAPIARHMDTQAYINVRHRVLEQGLDALPAVRGGRAVAADRTRYGEVLEKYMNM